MFPVPQIELHWVVELINEFSDLTREAAGEQDRPYPRLATPDGAAQDVAFPRRELVAVANELHAIFAAAERGEPVDAAINAILDRARPWQRAISTGAGFAVADVHDVLPAACALGLLAWIDARGTQRIGVCDGSQCVDVFADASAAGNKRFCSPTCSNRHKVAQYRARQRERTEGPPS